MAEFKNVGCIGAILFANTFLLLFYFYSLYQQGPPGNIALSTISKYSPDQPGQEKYNSNSIWKKLDFLIEKFCNKDHQRYCRAEQLDRKNIPPDLTTDNVSNQALNTMKMSTLLIVIFNHDTNYATVPPLIYSIYGRLFKEIHFCGPNENRRNFTRDIEEKFQNAEIANFLTSFHYSYETNKKPIRSQLGEISYICLEMAIEKWKSSSDQKLQGVFVMQDDVILNYWLFIEKNSTFSLQQNYSPPFNQIIFNVQTMKQCQKQSKKCSSQIGWPWANRYRSQLRDFKRDFFESDNFKAEREQLKCATGGPFRMIGGWSDFYYVTGDNLVQLLKVFKVLAKNDVYQEIAVPTALAALPQAKFQFVEPKFIQQGVGTAMVDNLKSLYNASGSLLYHPFKLSFVNLEKPSLGSYENCLFCELSTYAWKFVDKHLTKKPIR